MKCNKIIVTIVSIPDCPACDQLKDIVTDLHEGNQFLRDNIDYIEVVKPSAVDHTEFPIFQIRRAESKRKLFEAVGCYSRASVMWKLIKWITHG